MLKSVYTVTGQAQGKRQVNWTENKLEFRRGQLWYLLPTVELRTKSRRHRVRRNIINITQLKIVVLGWIFSLVLLCETEVCSVHIQPSGTNVTCDFRKCTRLRPMLILSLQSLPQNQNLERILFCTVVQCYPHNKNA